MKLIALASLSLLCMVGCSQQENARSFLNHSPAQNLEPEPTTILSSEATQAPIKTMQFGFFSDHYNFTRNTHANYPYAQSRFPVREGSQSQVALLNNTTDILAARWQLLENAKYSVRIQTLSFWADEAGWEFAQKLIELHKKGIDVRIIIDPISNLDPRAQWMYTVMQNNGVKIEGFEILYLFFLNGMIPGDKPAELVNKLNLRPHEKMFIVDAEDPARARAIIGGSNLSKHYFRIEPSKSYSMWRDRDVMVRGQVALDITGHFDENYAELFHIKQNYALFNTDILWDYYYKIRKSFNYDDSKISVQKPDQNPQNIAEFQRVAHLPVQLHWISAEKVRPLRNRPRNREWLIEDAYLDFIDSSNETISIMNAYFIPSKQMIDTLKNAVRRGVHVRILTNSRESSAVDLIPVAARAQYKDLLSVNAEPNLNGGQIEIYEWMAEEGLGNGEGHHHGKYAIFDSKASIVGSFNLEARSRLYNSENILAVLDEEFAAELEAQFYEESGPHYSKLVSSAEAASFREPDGFIEVLRYGLAALATPLL